MALLGNFIKRIWGQPLARGLDIESADTIAIHRRIVEANPLLKDYLYRIYGGARTAYEETKGMEGELVEIGSGSGYLNEVIPGLIRTEIVPSPYADRVMDAQQLDFPDESLRCLFLNAVLHHVYEPAKFLAEAQRCLKPRGRLVMVEPSNNWTQRIICKLVNHYEYYDSTITEWRNLDAARLDKANLALPWVIFVRDRKLFDERFPKLRVRRIFYHTFVAFLVSGGWSYRPFLPGFALPVVHGIEWLAKPFLRWIGSAMTIDVEKLA